MNIYLYINIYIFTFNFTVLYKKIIRIYITSVHLYSTVHGNYHQKAIRKTQLIERQKDRHPDIYGDIRLTIPHWGPLVQSLGDKSMIINFQSISTIIKVLGIM